MIIMDAKSFGFDKDILNVYCQVQRLDCLQLMKLVKLKDIIHLNLMQKCASLLMKQNQLFQRFMELYVDALVLIIGLKFLLLENLLVTSIKLIAIGSILNVLLLMIALIFPGPKLNRLNQIWENLLPCFVVFILLSLLLSVVKLLSPKSLLKIY